MLLIYLMIINAAGFILMLADKFKARKKLWRIPESALFSAALLGGALGVLAGMYLFRHKTRHLQFALGIPVILVIQAAIIFFVSV